MPFSIFSVYCSLTFPKYFQNRGWWLDIKGIYHPGLDYREISEEVDFKVNDNSRDAFLDGVTRNSRQPTHDLVMRKKIGWEMSPQWSIPTADPPAKEALRVASAAISAPVLELRVWGVQGMGRRQDKEGGSAEGVTSHCPSWQLPWWPLHAAGIKNPDGVNMQSKSSIFKTLALLMHSFEYWPRILSKWKDYADFSTLNNRTQSQREKQLCLSICLLNGFCI